MREFSLFPDCLFVVSVAISVANRRFQFISVAISTATWSIFDRTSEGKKKSITISFFVLDFTGKYIYISIKHLKTTEGVA